MDILEALDELTDRLDHDGKGWESGDYTTLLDISDYLHSIR